MSGGGPMLSPTTMMASFRMPDLSAGTPQSWQAMMGKGRSLESDRWSFSKLDITNTSEVEALALSSQHPMWLCDLALDTEQHNSERASLWLRAHAHRFQNTCVCAQPPAATVQQEQIGKSRNRTTEDAVGDESQQQQQQRSQCPICNNNGGKGAVDGKEAWGLWRACVLGAHLRASSSNALSHNDAAAAGGVAPTIAVSSGNSNSSGSSSTTAADLLSRKGYNLAAIIPPPLPPPPLVSPLQLPNTRALHNQLSDFGLPEGEIERLLLSLELQEGQHEVFFEDFFGALQRVAASFTYSSSEKSTPRA